MIFNLSTDIIISKKEKICKSTLSQALGLMFQPKKNLIMIFPQEKKISLHMFFVFYPITVILLDQHKKVVEIKPYFKPFTVWNSTTKGKYLIELGIAHHPLKIGNRLSFSEKS